MLGEVIRVNCENYTKHISTLCAQNVGFLNGVVCTCSYSWGLRD